MPELRLIPRRACENGSVQQLILGHVDTMLSDVDWALDSLSHRLRHMTGQEASSQDERAVEKLCATLRLVIDVFGTLSRVDDWPWGRVGRRADQDARLRPHSEHAITWRFFFVLQSTCWTACWRCASRPTC